MIRGRLFLQPAAWMAPLLVLLLSGRAAVAQGTTSRVQLGFLGGFASSFGPPGIRGAGYGEGEAAFRIAVPLWGVVAAGVVPTESDRDGAFTVNLYFARLALRFDLPVHLPGPGSLRGDPYLLIGTSVLDFDPGKDVDAEDSHRRWSLDTGGGVTYVVSRRIGVRLSGRFSVMTTDVERFPIAPSRHGSRIALQTFLGTGLIIRL